jgi:hypothetical protein
VSTPASTTIRRLRNVLALFGALYLAQVLLEPIVRLSMPGMSFSAEDSRLLLAWEWMWFAVPTGLSMFVAAIAYRSVVESTRPWGWMLALAVVVSILASAWHLFAPAPGFGPFPWGPLGFQFMATLLAVTLGSALAQGLLRRGADRVR